MAYAAATESRVELARAKVNLTLHVTGQRPDGYHLLESFVVFPQIGDRLAIEPANRLGLRLEGPFAQDLDGPLENNLILKAVSCYSKRTRLPIPQVRLTLSKRLPVASGIGGGSSDAATTLRLLQDFTGKHLSKDDLHDLALTLGADVPVCLKPEPQVMRGIGDDISMGPALPRCAIVLVNPRVEVSTPDVFKSMWQRNNPEMPPLPDRFQSLTHLTDYLGACRNDLQQSAIGLCPQIADVIGALNAENRIHLARMSGSGATVFGLCDTGDATGIEQSLRASHPEWWIASGPLT